MEDEFLSLMDDAGETREDLKCPDGDIGEEIKKSIENETDILVSRTILIVKNTIPTPLAPKRP